MALAFLTDCDSALKYKVYHQWSLAPAYQRSSGSQKSLVGRDDTFYSPRFAQPWELAMAYPPPLPTSFISNQPHC